MEMIYDNILGTIGRTPMVRLNRLPRPGSAQVLCKVESFNPMHSVKDRIAKAMIEEAERTGAIEKGGEIIMIEPTSGNTGIGLAMVCAVKGYRLVLAMPESMTMERRKLLKALGAELVLTPGPQGMSGAVDAAKRIHMERPGSFMPQQFSNPANPATHAKNTAEEILLDVERPDAFVAGVGTGGTITGIARVLKARGMSTSIVAVEPASSPVLSGGRPGAHRIQGIGAGFVPPVLDLDLIDRIIQVRDDDAIATTRELAKKEGMLCGISSGAAVHAALMVAEELGEGKTVVTLLPDTGERYLSTDVFEG